MSIQDFSLSTPHWLFQRHRAVITPVVLFSIPALYNSNNLHLVWLYSCFFQDNLLCSYLVNSFLLKNIVQYGFLCWTMMRARLSYTEPDQRCSRCDNVIRIGVKVSCQKVPYVAIEISRNEFCEVRFNENRRKLIHIL